MSNYITLSSEVTYVKPVVSSIFLDYKSLAVVQRFIADSIDLTDSFSRVVIVESAITDDILVVDDKYERFDTYSLNTSPLNGDIINGNKAPYVKITPTQGTSDTIALSENAGIHFQKGIVDSIDLADNTSIVLGIQRAIGDIITVTDDKYEQYTDSLNTFRFNEAVLGGGIAPNVTLLSEYAHDLNGSMINSTLIN